MAHLIHLSDIYQEKIIQPVIIIVFLEIVPAYANIDGDNNTFLGGRAGFSNIHGSFNTYVGNGAGFGNTSGTGNDFVGTFAGFYNPGYDNTIIGCFAGFNSVGGNEDILIGTGSGYLIKGSNNLLIGNGAAGEYTSTGNYNLILGNLAGQANTTGSKNVFIGYNAGYFNAVGSSNVFIGYQVGYNEIGSNKLYIDNSNTSSPLIWGDFSSRILNFNGNVGIGTSTPGQKLDIIAGNGRVQTGYNWLTNSDIRYKKNISFLSGCLEKVLAMKGVSFDLKNDSLNVGTERKNIGFIAQELEKVVPEVVFTGSDGYKSVAYDKITAVLTEAIKEQQKQIECQQKQINSINLENQQLRSELDELKTLVNPLVANQTSKGSN